MKPCLPEHLAAVIARQMGVARRAVKSSRRNDGGVSEARDRLR